MRATGGLMLATVSLFLVACGDQVASDATDLSLQTDSKDLAVLSIPKAAPETLTCPSGEMVGTAGGYLAEFPDGFDTREEAVADWLSDSESPDGRDWSEAAFVIDEDGRQAWILRSDGTAEARVDFMRHKGFTVHGYDACS